jgi:hypothetical protein
MLQTGHHGGVDLPQTIKSIRTAASEDPHMPVLDGEPTYEGVFGSAWQGYQRFQYWACVLSGSIAGYTYGAAGIWEMNTPDEQAGMAPNGRNWSITPWQQAYKLPGSYQVGLSKALLVRYPWWRIEYHPEWVEPHWNGEMCPRPFAGGIPGELRLVYVPGTLRPPTIRNLEPQATYDAYMFDPVRGTVYAGGKVSGRDADEWRIPHGPIVQDWVVVLEREDKRSGLHDGAVPWKPYVYPYR